MTTSMLEHAREMNAVDNEIMKFTLHKRLKKQRSKLVLPYVNLLDSESAIFPIQQKFTSDGFINDGTLWSICLDSGFVVKVNKEITVVCNSIHKTCSRSSTFFSRHVACDETCEDALIRHRVEVMMRNINRNHSMVMRCWNADIFFIRNMFSHVWCEIHCQDKKFTKFLKKVIDIIQIFSSGESVKDNACCQKEIARHLNTLISKEFIILCAQRIRHQKCIFLSYETEAMMSDDGPD